MFTRTSIQAAKRNAQSHRDADGGQIDWRNESLRRHGALERPKDQQPIQQLVSSPKYGVEKVVEKDEKRLGEQEILLSRKIKGKGMEK